MLKNAGALTTARLTGDGLSFLLFIVLSRRFGLEGIGHYAFGMAVAGLAYALVNFGLENFSIRECAKLDAQERSSFLGRLLGHQIGLALLVLILLVGFFAIKGLTAQDIQIASLLSAYFIILVFSKMLFTPAFSQQYMVVPSLTELFCRVCIIFSAIFLVTLRNAPLPVALLPYPVGSLVLLVFAVFSSLHFNKKLSITISLNQAKETFLAAWPFGASIIIITLQVRIGYLVLGTLSGPEATGIYASGIKFLETGVFPLVYLGLAAYPGLSSSFHANRETFQRLSDRLFRTSMVGGALLAWLLIFVAPELIVPILGPSFSSTKSMLQSIGILGILMAVDLPANRLMFAANLQQLRVKLMSFGVLVNLVLAVLLVPSMGVFGAVTATVLGQLVITTLSLKALISRGLSPLTWRMGLSFLISLFGAFVTGKIAHLIFGGEWAPALGSLATICLVLIGTGFISPAKVFSELREKTPRPVKAE